MWGRRERETRQWMRMERRVLDQEVGACASASNGMVLCHHFFWCSQHENVGMIIDLVSRLSAFRLRLQCCFCYPFQVPEGMVICPS